MRLLIVTLAFVGGIVLGSIGATVAHTAWVDRYVCTWFQAGPGEKDRMTDDCNRRALSGMYAIRQASGLNALILERPKIARFFASDY